MSLANVTQVNDDFLNGYYAERKRTYWDTVTIPTTGTAIAAGDNFVFFRDIQSKTDLDTNMTESNRLPLDYRATIYRMRVYLPPATVADDAAILLNQGLVRLYTDEIDLRLSGRMSEFPQGGGLYVMFEGAHAGTAEYSTNGYPSFQAAPPLGQDNVIKLKEGQTFRATVDFLSAATVTTTTDVVIYLDTQLYRPIV